MIKCEEENISLLLSIRHILVSYTVICKIIIVHPLQRCSRIITSFRDLVLNRLNNRAPWDHLLWGRQSWLLGGLWCVTQSWLLGGLWCVSHTMEKAQQAALVFPTTLADVEWLCFYDVFETLLECLENSKTWPRWHFVKHFPNVHKMSLKHFKKCPLNVI